MILPKNTDLYEMIIKLAKDLGPGGTGLLLTFRSLESDSPGGIEENVLLNSSSDGIESNKIVLEILINKGYLRKNDEGLLVSTDKEI